MDLLAQATGVDSADVRQRNFISPSRFPFEAASGAKYDFGDYAKPLDEVLRLVDLLSAPARAGRGVAGGTA